MAFVVPVFAAIGSALGSIGSAVGGALGIGGTAAAGAAGAAGTAAGAATAATGLFGTSITLGQALTTAATLGSAGLGLVGTAMSAKAQLTGGENQAMAYQLAATNALIEGNQRAMEYKRQGNQVMSRTIETDALIKAKAAAGGIDPFSGSAGALSEYAFMKGVEEYNLAQENAQFAVMQGKASEASYNMAAASALKTGQQSAIATGVLGASKFLSSGAPQLVGSLFSSSTPTSSASTSLSPYTKTTGFASPIARA